jgi:segregation and condensation protein A
MPVVPAANPSVSALPSIRLHDFEGPLDLLLHLVRQGRMDIQDLPVTPLCDQYLAHLSAMEQMNLQIAGEFFVMAATLLEIKSRSLLPKPPRQEPPEEGEPADPRAELAQRLLEYGKYQAIAQSLRDLEGERRTLFFRAPTEYNGAFALPPRFGEMSADHLLRTLERLLASAGAGEQQITSVRRQKITLRMKMREVLTFAERAGLAGVALADLLPAPPFPLLEVVLLFLALLELLKGGSVLAAQEDFCGEIRVFFVPESERAALITSDNEGAQA